MTNEQYQQALANQRLWRPRTLSERGAVNRCLRRLADESRDRERAIRAWNAVCDASWDGAASVLSFVDGVLTLGTRDELLIGEIRRTRATLLRKLQRRLGGLRRIEVERTENEEHRRDVGTAEVERNHVNGRAYE